MASLTFTRSSVGIETPQPLPMSRPDIRFEATLRADVGEVAACVVRPLAAETSGHPGFLVGGEVTLGGTADSNGLVQVDGFPFQASFARYGMEVVSISGTGASVTGLVAA